MNELEILLDELRTNKNLENKLDVFIKDFFDLKKFIVNNDVKTNIIFSPGSESIYYSALEDIKKYSLFLVDKIITLTQINGKNIYTIEDIFDLIS